MIRFTLSRKLHSLTNLFPALLRCLTFYFEAIAAAMSAASSALGSCFANSLELVMMAGVAAALSAAWSGDGSSCEWGCTTRHLPTQPSHICLCCYRHQLIVLRSMIASNL